MQTAHASSPAGRLDERSLGGGAMAPFKSGNPAGTKTTSPSFSSGKQSMLAAGRQANSSTLPGPELPSMESIKLLLARYPALGPALQQLDWDEHGRISKTTLLRIISALDGDTLLQQQQTGPAHPEVANAAEQDIAGGVGRAETGGSTPVAAAAVQPAGPAQPQGQTTATAPSATAQGPPASSQPAGTAPTALSLADGFAAAWGKLHAGVSSSIFCPTPAADAATSTSTPTSACGGFSPAAAAPGSMSGSAGSSRRTSLRPTLSIDISSIHVSDSSDSSQEEDEEPPAPAPGQHGPCSHSGGAASTGSHSGAAAGNPISASLTDGALFQHTPHPAAAGELQEGSDSEGAVPVATSSSGSGAVRKQRCSTPGHALHGSMHVFSNPMALGSDEDQDPEGPAPAAGHGQHSMHAAYCSAGDSGSDRETEGQQGREQSQHRAGAKPGRKAQTPAKGLGKPVSIFSRDGSLRHSHAAASAAEGHAHGMRPAHAAGGSGDDGHEHEQQPAAEQQGSTHSWKHKLSKRPATPGVSLSQPVSIFSGSGSSLEAGLAHLGPQHHGCAGSSLEDTHHAVSFGFAQQQHASSASTRAGDSTSTTRTGRRQLAERPQSAPGAGHKHGWHRKLSQRPPTPGAALGKPISIFSASGGHAEGGSESDSGDESPAGEESPREPAGQRLIKFADDHGSPLELGPARGHAKHGSTPAAGAVRPQHQQGKGSSSQLGPAHADPEHASTPAAGDAQAQHTQQQGKGGHQEWGHKLSKRPPTPGVSLTQPVSIFSNSSSRVNTPSAAPAPHHQPCWRPTASHDSKDAGNSDDDDGASDNYHHHPSFSQAGVAGHPGSRSGAPAHPGDSTSPTGVYHQALSTQASTTSSSGSKGAHAGEGATARAAAASATGEPEQQHWHHKLSKRPPTPGVSLGKPVSIFSCGGSTSQGEGQGCQGSAGSTGGSEGSCSEGDGDGHVHFAAAGAVHGSGSVGGRGQERPHSAPAAHWQHPTAAGRARGGRSSDSEGEGCAVRQKVVWAHTPADAASAAHGSSSSSGRNTLICFKESTQAAGGAASSDEEGCTAPASSSSGRGVGHSTSGQQGRHKHSKRAPTPGASLGKPVSIFDDRHGSSAAAALTHAAPSAAVQLTQRHGGSSSEGVHIQFLDEHGIPSRHAPQQHSSLDRRVSWGDQAERAFAAHVQQTQHHSSSGSASAGSATHHTAGGAASSGSGPAKPERRRITWEDSAPGADGGMSADRRSAEQQADSSTSGSRRITWEDSAPAGGSGIPPGVEQHAAETAHERRRVTWEDSDAEAAPSHGRPAGCLVRATSGPENDGSRPGVHAVSWGGEGERTDEVVAPGMFRHTGDDSEDAAEGVEVCQAGSSNAAAASAPQAGGAGAAAAAARTAAAGGSAVVPAATCPGKSSLLGRLKPALAAEAQEQKWQQRMAQRPPTPGDPLHTQPNSASAADVHSPSRSRLQSPEPFGDASQGHQLQQAGALTGSSASSTSGSTPTAPAAGGGASTAKAALLKLHPALAAEAQQQKWQQRMANRSPTPGDPLHTQPNSASAADGHSSSNRSSRMQSPEPFGNASQQQQPSPAAAVTSGSASSTNSSSPSAGRPSAAKAALLKLHPELAAEAQQQQWQQHMANRPPTPGASLLQHNMFAEDADDYGSDASGVVMATISASSSAAPKAVVVTATASSAGTSSTSSTGSRSGSPGSGVGSPSSGAGRVSAKAALLKLRPELAAEAQQQQWQQHMANRPPTPGASLLQHNMFADDGEDDGKLGDGPAASSFASPQAAAAAAAVGSPGRASSGSPSGPLPVKAALLKLHPELAAEAQQQQWQQHMANRPPTPGASLLQHNMFAEGEGDEAEDSATAEGGAAAAAGRVSASRTSSAAVKAPGSAAIAPGSAAEALVLHNPDLALETEQQWEQKLSRRPPTPAATLGKPFNMFTDGDEEDIEEQQQAAVVMLQQPPQAAGRLSSSSSSGMGAVEAAEQGAAETLRRTRSPDQARSASNSSNGSSSAASSPTRSNSTGAAAAPAHGAAAAANLDSDSSTNSSSSRPGSSNPGRQRGSSPLRNTTTAAEVAEQQERATHSPLRHSSSLCDPDPARMSPLGRRGSSTGNSPVSSAPSTPSAAATAAAAMVVAPAAAAAAAVTVNAPAVGDGQEVKGGRQGQASSSEPHSPSRLGRSPSPSPSVLEREAGGPASLVQRSSSPLGRSTSTNQAAASPVRHGSPLSRCSSGGMC